MKEYLMIFLTTYSKTLLDAGYKILLALVIMFLGKSIAKLVRNSVKQVSVRFHTLDATLVPIFSTIAGYFIYAIALLIVLDIFGVNTSSIIALIGAAGLAIGLALKDTLTNIAAGIMLLILRPISVGDFVECGVVIGTIQEIGLFTTILKTSDGIYISSPNGFLWSGNIKNYTRNGQRRMDITIHISNIEAIDIFFKKLNEIIYQEKRFLNEPHPEVIVQAKADSSTDIHLRAWAHVSEYWDVYWDTNKKINDWIQQSKLSTSA